MQTLGVDLSAEPKKTGVAWLEWSHGGARVRDLQVGMADAELVNEMSTADKTGIDCPLGWPKEFVAFITRHQDGHVEIEPGLATEWRRRLSYRLTDIHVQKSVPGIQGLSVSSDRIGVTTMRCAALLSHLAASGRRVVRTGAGPVAEVYPAASLVRWGFNHKGYKGKNGAVRRGRLVDELQEAAPWLALGDQEKTCRASDDALDGVLAALTARAAAIGQTEEIPKSATAAAAVEGWIALPALGSTLAALVRPGEQPTRGIPAD